MKSTLLEIAVGALFVCTLGKAVMAETAFEQSKDAPTPATYRQLAAEVEANLQTHILEKWYPAATDNAGGGFFQNFREDWSHDLRNDKTLVYQSRLTWLAAQAAERFPNKSAMYKRASLHGVEFLEQKLWDGENGGFFWGLEPDGTPQRNGEKHAYGIAFGLYSAAACYHATQEPRALELAKRTYQWLDVHAYDKKNGGYYEALTREGKPILAPPSAEQPNDFIGTHYGYKSMNSHIHLLEALTALYDVWRDDGLRRRLNETFLIVRDKIAVMPGCLNLYFTPDWRPIPDHDSFGHDVETAFLLVEAATALGKPDDAATWKVARMLVNHALDYGWDDKNGGFYDAGTAFGAATVTEKIWWTQAEGLNALLLMHARFGKETPRYWEAFVKQWQWIQRFQVDAKYGGWFANVSKEGTPPAGRAKSDQWTEAYHQGRALLTVSDELRRLAR